MAQVKSHIGCANYVRPFLKWKKDRKSKIRNCSEAKGSVVEQTPRPSGTRVLGENLLRRSNWTTLPTPLPEKGTNLQWLSSAFFLCVKCFELSGYFASVIWSKGSTDGILWNFGKEKKKGKMLCILFHSLLWTSHAASRILFALQRFGFLTHYLFLCLAKTLLEQSIARIDRSKPSSCSMWPLEEQLFEQLHIVSVVLSFQVLLRWEQN